MDGERRIQIADYVVIGLSITMSVLIGVFYAYKDRRIRSTENYFLAGRKQSALPTALSYTVTYLSSVLFLAIPGEGYMYGVQFCFSMVGEVLANYVSCFFIIPILQPLKLSSGNEYLLLRYKSKVLQCAGGIFAIFICVLYVSVVLLGNSLAFEYMTGYKSWVFMIIFASAAVIYTTIGGLKAVIWADVLQAVVMVSGILVVVTKGIIDSGGPTNVARLSSERFEAVSFSFDPILRQPMWFLITYFFISGIYSPILPTGFQRVSAVPDSKTASRVLILAAFFTTGIVCAAVFQGVVLFAYFSSKECDPFAAGIVDNVNKLLPYAVLDMFHQLPGTPGLILSALLSASLSTISSSLGAVSFTVAEDIFKPVYPDVTEERLSAVAKVCVVLSGGLSICIAHAMATVNLPLHQILITVSGSPISPLAALFLMSFCIRWSNIYGVICGLVSGSGISLWISYGQPFLSNSTPDRLPLGPTDACFNLTQERGINFSTNAPILPTAY